MAEHARPACLVLAVGTATGIGKTWVGARTLENLRGRGIAVGARKPVQSFGRDERGATDAEVLARATGEAPLDVCPSHRWYEAPMAPPMAADALGRPAVRIADLLAELAWVSPAPSVGWVETVGGPRSPMAEDGDAVTLAGGVDPDLVVLVADAGLGTINAVLLSLEPFVDRWPVTTILNRFDDRQELHRRNRSWLASRADSTSVVTTPAALAAQLGSR